MIANDIVSRPDFMNIIKAAISRKIISPRIGNLDDFAQDVAMHILEYPPKKEYAPAAVIIRTCRWVQKEWVKRRNQTKFEDTVCNFTNLGIEGEFLREGVYEHQDFKDIENSDYLDEIVLNANLGPEQSRVIQEMRQGFTQKDIARKIGVTPQNISFLYNAAIKKMKESSESCTKL